MLSHKLRRYKSGAPTDANFKQTTLLLHGDGTNGGQNNTFLAANHASGGLPGGFGAYFDGNGDYLTASSSTGAFGFGTGDFTIELWFYVLSSQNQFLCDFRTAFPQNAPLIYTDGNGTLFYYVGSSALINAGAVPVNTWTHVAVARSGTSTKMFVNGSQVGSTASDSTNYIDNSIVRIGKNETTVYANGYISNVRVVKGTAVYTSNFTVPTAPLTAITNTSLLTCHASTFIDGSTNNFTVTANGDAKVVTTSDSGLVVTRNGNTTQGTFSPFSVADGEWSNYFDGTGDYLVSSTNSSVFNFGTGDFTAECWFYATSIGRQHSLIDLRTAQSNNWVFYITTTNTIAVFDGSSSSFSTATITANTWNHIAWSRSGTTFRTYLNGVEVLSTSNSKNNNTDTKATIGASFDTTGASLGYISNVRVLKGTALYTSAFTVPTSPLTAITNTSLLTCQSNRFRDASTNNFTFTRNGDVTVRPFSPFAPTAAYSESTNGGSGYFDGTGDYLSVSISNTVISTTGDFTVETWVYTNSTASQTILALRGNNTSYAALRVGLQSGQCFLLVSTTGSSWQINSGLISSVPLRSWNHIAVTRGGNTFTVYVNGTSVYTSTAISSGTSLMTGSYNYIGAIDNSGLAEYVNGYIAGIRVINGTATAPPSGGPTSPVTAVSNTSLLLNFTNAAIIDNTGKNVLETVGNAQIDTGTKKFGTGALEFDGTGDWLLAPNTPDNQLGTGNFTIELWVYLATGDIGSNRGLISKGTASTGWSVSLNTTEKVVFSYTSSTITSSGAITSNAWNHIAVVREGTGSNQTKIYINGTNDGTGTVSTDFNQTDSLYVGANRTGGDPMKGFIDDVRITKGIARYTANFTAPTAAFEDR